MEEGRNLRLAHRLEIKSKCIILIYLLFTISFRKPLIYNKSNVKALINPLFLLAFLLGYFFF